MFGETNFLRPIVEGKDPVLDIVAVHGLNPSNKKSHADTTWTAENGKSWLREFLPEKIPNARILLFGYNSKLFLESNMMGIEDHAGNLLDRLDMKRLDHPDRPILFIAHSLGGIVVKKALVKASMDTRFQSIQRATFGLVFFGTPHHGGNIRDFGEFAVNVATTVLNSPKNPLIKTLKSNSQLLADLSEQFRHQQDLYQVVSFYEMKPVNKKGINVVVVDKTSSLMGLSGKRERQVGLDRDHNEICKFSKEDSDEYEQVSDNICWLAREAIASSRTKQSPLPSLTALSTPALGSHSQLHDLDLGYGHEEHPKSVFVVPIRNSPNFVGREKILLQLEAHLTSMGDDCQHRVALWGLGGVGKTKIARKFADQIRQHHHGISIFWVDASNSERFYESISNITRRLKISGADQPQADVIDMFKEWLSDQAGIGGRWLMIIDQLDDIQALRAAVQKDGRTKVSPDPPKEASLIPDHPNSLVLITTRDRRVAVEADCTNANIIPVTAFERAEAVKFVQLSLKKRDEQEEDDAQAIEELIKTLDCMPEAIDQAAKKMVTNGTSVSEYSKQFRETEDGTGSRDISTTTWLTSFEKIRKTNSDSADLLSLMAYLDCNGIPQNILRQYKKELSGWDFREACGRLKAFSILEDMKMDKSEEKQDDDGNSGPKPIKTLGGHEGQESGKFGQKTDEKLLFVPRMVHDHVQRWLQSHGESETWINRAVGALLEVFPAPDGANWSSHEIYLPHVTAVINHLPCPMLDSEDVATLLDRISGYHRIRGYYSSAETYGRKALRIRKNLLGHQVLNPATIASTTNVSRILLEFDRLPEAEALQEPAADICRNTLGLKHRETIDAVCHLAAIRGMQGRLQEAEELGLEIVNASVTHFGHDSIHTLRGMRDLAITYGFQKHHDKAMGLQVEVLEGFKRILGEHHPETLIVMSDLATTHAFQYHFKDAEGLFRRIAHTSKKVLGPKHPHTKRALQNFEDMLQFQGLQNEADELRQAWDLNWHSSHPKRPDGTPLSPVGRSMSDTVATIKIYRKAGIQRSRTFLEGLPSAQNALGISNGPVEPIDGLTEKAIELGRGVSNFFKNVAQKNSPVPKPERQAEGSDSAPQFNSGMFEGAGAETEGTGSKPDETPSLDAQYDIGTSPAQVISTILDEEELEAGRPRSVVANPKNSEDLEAQKQSHLQIDSDGNSIQAGPRNSEEYQGESVQANVDERNELDREAEIAEEGRFVDGLLEERNPASQSRLQQSFDTFKKEELANIWKKRKVLFKKKSSGD